MPYPYNNLFFRLSKKHIPTTFINRLSSATTHALGCPKPISVTMNSHSFRVFHPLILSLYPSSHTHFETSRKQDFLSSFSFSLLFSQLSLIISLHWAWHHHQSFVFFLLYLQMRKARCPFAFISSISIFFYPKIEYHISIQASVFFPNQTPQPSTPIKPHFHRYPTCTSQQQNTTPHNTT